MTRRIIGKRSKSETKKSKAKAKTKSKMRYSIQYEKCGDLYSKTYEADSEEDALRMAKDDGLENPKEDGFLTGIAPMKEDGSVDLAREVKFHQSPHHLAEKIKMIREMAKLNNSGNR